MSALRLTTERLVVRPWRVEEAPRLLDLLSRVEVVRWLDSGPPRPMADLAQAQERIAHYHRRSQGSDLGFWAVEVRETGQVAGTVLLSTLPGSTTGEVEIGWHLHPDCWGHGYAAEAAAAVLDHAFAAGLPEVWAITFLDNYPSQAVARAIGMRDTGVDERWYDGASRIYHVDRGEPG